MERIKETIKTVFSDWEGKNKEGAPGEIKDILKKVLAKNALVHVKLFNFRKGILSIKVDSSTWLYYLNLQKDDLLVKLREYLNTIKSIRFSLGD
ncbi:MAG: DciA family protein [Candidatus Omnitrophota bacterium]